MYYDIWLSIITLKTTGNCFFKPELYQEKKCTVPSISFLFARKTIGMPCNSFSISNDVSRSSASWSRSRADPSITKSIPINKIKINQNKCMKVGYYASPEVQGFWSDPPYIVRIIAEKNNWLEKMAIVIVAAHVITFVLYLYKSISNIKNLHAGPAIPSLYNFWLKLMWTIVREIWPNSINFILWFIVIAE